MCGKTTPKFKLHYATESLKGSEKYIPGGYELYVSMLFVFYHWDEVQLELHMVFDVNFLT